MGVEIQCEKCEDGLNVDDYNHQYYSYDLETYHYSFDFDTDIPGMSKKGHYMFLCESCYNKIGRKEAPISVPPHIPKEQHFRFIVSIIFLKIGDVNE